MDHDGLYKTADGAALRFFDEPRQNNHASEKNGRPIFDMCLLVEVITPGSRESAPVFELERQFADEVGIAEPRRSAKFAEYRPQIEAYRSGADSPDMRGTPLTAWPAVSSAIAAAAKHAGVFTVEGLANLPDSRLSALGPGALSLRSRAIAFLAAAGGNANSEAMASDNAVLTADNERLKGEVAELSKRLGEAEAKLASLPPPVDPLADDPPPPPPPVVEQTPPPAPVKPPKAVKAAGGNAMPII